MVASPATGTGAPEICSSKRTVPETGARDRLKMQSTGADGWSRQKAKIPGAEVSAT